MFKPFCHDNIEHVKNNVTFLVPWMNVRIMIAAFTGQS